MNDDMPDWKSELVPGEEVLWTGHPDPGSGMRLPQIASLIFGVPALLAGLWMLATSGGDMFLISIAVVPAGFGAAALYFGFVKEPDRLRATRYALTNKRGFVIVEGAEKRPIDWRDITADSHLSLDEHGNGRGSVWFHKELVNRSGEAGGSRTHFFGFQQIVDAPKVHAMIEDIQKRMEQPGGSLDGLLDGLPDRPD